MVKTGTDIKPTMLDSRIIMVYTDDGELSDDSGIIWAYQRRKYSITRPSGLISHRPVRSYLGIGVNDCRCSIAHAEWSSAS